MKEKVDILIKGGTLLTLDIKGTMYEDGAIAVKDSNHIQSGEVVNLIYEKAKKQGLGG